ncbi:hypothetical protein ACFYY2_04395 [Streptomyces sp. NPDC001822]|uniref:hypothetical protein n=1 Tax=Streptomyces sp. NPDC001822 TaxID=3364614 RepID=UPI0036D1B86B
MKRWLRITAFAVALAIGVGIASPAYAGQPGESNYWSPEVSNGQNVQGRGEDEARAPNGDLVEVWRGWTNDEIYLSVNNGPARRWQSTLSGNVARTYARPRVVWTDAGWRIWHTGVDGHIYYGGISVSGGQLVGFGEFWQVPNNAVTRPDQPPAVVALPGGESAYLAWVGSNSNQIYGLYYNGGVSPTVWGQPVAIPHATSATAPNLAFNRNWGTDQLGLTWAGEDHGVYLAWQTYGTSSWSTFHLYGRSTNVTPSIVFTDNGTGQLAIIPYVNGSSSGATEYTTLRSDRTWGGQWTTESQQLATWNHLPPTLATYNNVVYSIAIALNGYMYWKASGDYSK